MQTTGRITPVSSQPHKNYAMYINMTFALLITLYSMMPWFLWEKNVFKAICVFMFLATGFSQIRWNSNVKISLYMIFIFIFTFLHAKIGQIPTNASIYRIISMLPLFVFPLFPIEYMRMYLKLLIKLFSIILAISLPFFAAWMVGIPLPHSVLLNSNEFYTPFTNYNFFIIVYDFGALTRFQSIFTEPGHLGTFCAILLYVNGYSWKKWSNIVMTIALLWSFSLAGYLLYIIGLVLNMLSSYQKSFVVMRKLIFALIGVSVLLGIVSLFNDEILDEVIFSRLELDKDKGIAGYNRNTKFFEQKYANMDVSDLTWGMDPEKYRTGGYGIANSSYKNFILQEGYVGLTVLAIALFLFLRTYPSRKGISLFIVLIFSFIQRPYILWEIESFTFFAATICYHYDQHNPNNTRPVKLKIRRFWKRYLKIYKKPPKRITLPDFQLPQHKDPSNTSNI